MSITILGLGLVFVLALMAGGPIVIYLFWKQRVPSVTLIQYEESVNKQGKTHPEGLERDAETKTSDALR